MTWWEWVSVLAGAGGPVASILGAWLTYAARWNGERTRALVRELALHNDQRHADSQAILERMDQRADERHREVIQVIQALRG